MRPNRRVLIWLMMICWLCAGGGEGYAQRRPIRPVRPVRPILPIKPQGPAVAAAIPRNVTLAPGGDPVAVVLHGSDLEQVTDAYVMMTVRSSGRRIGEASRLRGRGLRAKTVTARLLRPTGDRKGPLRQRPVFPRGSDKPGCTVVLTAAANASQDWTYELYLTAGRQRLRVPENVLRIGLGRLRIVALEGLPLPVPIDWQPDLGMPEVLSWDPQCQGKVNAPITFTGRNLDPNRFSARVGNQRLTMTQRSITRMTAHLPSRPVSGPLIVGYGTAASEYALEEDYRVFGNPTITAVVPARFAWGDRVTIRGSELRGAFPHRLGGLDLVKVSNTSIRTTPSGGATDSDWVCAYNWAWGADGRTIAFDAGSHSYVQSNGYAGTSNRTGTLTGRLRLKPTDGTSMTVASPSAVTWTGPPPLAVTSVTQHQYALGPALWNQPVDFILVPESGASIWLRGQGLLRPLAVTMASVALIEGFYSLLGDQSSYTVPFQAQSDRIRIVRTLDSSSTSTRAMKVVGWPRFTPDTLNTLQSPFAVQLNQIYDLRGWRLKPAGVNGLVYELVLEALNDSRQTIGQVERDCKVQFDLLEHTTGRIRFRVRTTGTVPDSCRQRVLFGRRGFGENWLGLRLLARYGGEEYPLFRTGYYLVMPE